MVHEDNVVGMLKRYDVDHYKVWDGAECIKDRRRELIANYFRVAYGRVSDEGRVDGVINEEMIDVMYVPEFPVPIYCNNLYTYCLMQGVYVPYYDWAPIDNRVRYGGRVYYLLLDLYVNEEYVTSDTSGEGNTISIPM